MEETEATKLEVKLEPKTGFLEESAGVKSSMRLISIMFAAYAIILPTIIWFTTNSISDTLLAFGTIGSIALGGKIIQKPMENKPI